MGYIYPKVLEKQNEYCKICGYENKKTLTITLTKKLHPLKDPHSGRIVGFTVILTRNEECSWCNYQGVILKQ